MFNLEMRIDRERAGPQGSISHSGSVLSTPLGPSFTKRGVFWPPPKQEAEADASPD